MKTIKKRTHAYYNSYRKKQQKANTENDTNTTQTKYISMPYVKGLSEKIQHVLKPHNLKLAHKTNNTTKPIFTQLKTQIPKEKKSNIVYEIPCQNCDSIYIGQTKQYLEKRIQEHKSKKDAHTALNDHTKQTGHTFNFQDTKILQTETNYYKRLFAETVEIKKHNNAINYKTDTTYFPVIYNKLLEHL